MLATIIFLLVTSTLLTWFFSLFFKNPGPWNSFWIFVTVLFLAMFGFILWVPPIGPVWYDIAWIDAILFGILITILIGATAENNRKDFPTNEKGEVDLVAAAKRDTSTVAMYGLFFWTFVITMSLIIIFGILHKMTMN